MVNVGIVGGTGYTGVELMRLLSMHPEARIGAITSRAEEGVSVGDIFPSLRGHVDLTFEKPSLSTLIGCDVVFFCYASWRSNGASSRVSGGRRACD